MKIQLVGEDYDDIDDLLQYLRDNIDDEIEQDEISFVRNDKLIVYSGWNSIVLIVVAGHGYIGFCEDPDHGKQDEGERIMQAIREVSRS